VSAFVKQNKNDPSIYSLVRRESGFSEMQRKNRKMQRCEGSKILTDADRLRNKKKVAMALGLCTFTADSSGQLNILWHDGHTLGVNRAQICIFEETH